MKEAHPFDSQPTLVGATVTLSPLRDDDWDALFAVAADPLIWEVHPAHDRWQEPVFRQFFANAMESGGCLVIRDKATGEVIGSSRYDPRRVEPGEVEIADPGLATEAPPFWGDVRGDDDGVEAGVFSDRQRKGGDGLGQVAWLPDGLDLADQSACLPCGANPDGQIPGGLPGGRLEGHLERREQLREPPAHAGEDLFLGRHIFT
jgi:hypothetical protein